MSNPVGWFEIYVSDMPRAKKFYQTVFATSLEKLEGAGMDDIEMWAFPMKPESFGASGALVKMRDCPSGGNSTLVYFSSADCAIEQQRATLAGGKVFRAKFSIGQYGYICLLVDTEGNLIGVHSMQ